MGLTAARRLCRPVLAFAAALALVAGVAPVQARAEGASVYSATATPHYRHPGTGTIEDQGGENSYALGQAMTESACDPAAFVEYDADGTPYVTLRLRAQDTITNLDIELDPDWSGSYQATDYEVMQSDDTNYSSDYRMQADPGDVFRIGMYVKPMGRDVVYFVTLSDLAEGNPNGFVRSVSADGFGDGVAVDAQSDEGGSSVAPFAAGGASGAAIQKKASSAPAGERAAAGSSPEKPVPNKAGAGSGAQAKPGTGGVQEVDAGAGRPAADASPNASDVTLPVWGFVILVVALALALGAALVLAILLVSAHRRRNAESAAAAAYAAQTGAVPARSGAPATIPADPAQTGAAWPADAATDGATSVMPVPRPSKDPSDGRS